MKKLLIKSINKTKQWVKDPIFWARFAGYAIPLAFLLYVLYINYLPFGYNKTFVINVGSPTDTKVSQFYLEPSPDLSDRKIDANGKPYRELNGMATAVFKPNVVLKNAKITVEVTGQGVSLIPPYLDFDPNSVQWDKSWDFTPSASSGQASIPKDLKNINNKVFIFDGAAYFDGTARLELASSSNMFESGPFTVYAEWMPINDASSSQQIVGHFNWELWQNKDSVYFQVGRMNNATGTSYSIKYPVDETFFNQKHSAIAIYSPSDTNGYIELFIDGKFDGRVNIGPDKIWKDYGKENLSIGWTPYNYRKSPHFKGDIFQIRMVFKNVIFTKSSVNIKNTSDQEARILIMSTGTSTITQLKLNAIQ